MARILGARSVRHGVALETDGRLARFGGWVDGLTDRRQWLLVFTVMSAIYLPTATWDFEVHVDAVMSAIPAYTLVHEGTLELSSQDDLVLGHRIAEAETEVSDRGRFSNRNPGSIFAAVPAYAVERLLLGDVPFRTGPAAVSASLIVAAAVATMSLVVRNLAANRYAIAAAMAAGLATPTWAVSADSTWAHGPNQLWLAIGLYFMAKQAYARSGLAYGLAVFTRPYSGAVAAASGIYLTLKKRDWRPVVLIGVTSALGVIAFLVYSRVLFEVTSVYGGYADRGYHQARLTSPPDTFLQDLWLSLMSPSRGLLLHSAFLIPLAVGFRKGWGAAEPWVKAAALSAAAYLVLQVRAGGWIGGDFYFGYRYQLEAVWVAVPFLFLAWQERIKDSPRLSMVFNALLASAFALQILGAVVEVYKA